MFLHSSQRGGLGFVWTDLLQKEEPRAGGTVKCIILTMVTNFMGVLEKGEMREGLICEEGIMAATLSTILKT